MENILLTSPRARERGDAFTSLYGMLKFRYAFGISKQEMVSFVDGVKTKLNRARGDEAAFFVGFCQRFTLKIED